MVRDHAVTRLVGRHVKELAIMTEDQPLAVSRAGQALLLKVRFCPPISEQMNRCVSSLAGALAGETFLALARGRRGNRDP